MCACTHVGNLFCESLVPPSQRFGRGGCDFLSSRRVLDKEKLDSLRVCLTPNVEHLSHVNGSHLQVKFYPTTSGSTSLTP